MEALIIWLMIVILMTQSASSLLAPFYPDMAIDTKGCSSLIVGMVLSSFSLSNIIASYVIGINIGKMGRRFSLYTGIIMQSLSMIGFGSLMWIENRTLFIILSFSFRLIGGVAWGLIWVAAYAMTSIKFPDSIQSKIAFLEAANGAGQFVGPIFGGLTYQFTNFFVPFLLFSTIFLLFLPFLRRKLTADLDRSGKKESQQNRVGYIDLIKHKRILFAAFANFFNILFLTVGQPIFGPRLTKDYGLSEAWVGVCFAIPTISYIITGPFLLPIITKGFEQRTTIMIGLFVFALVGYLAGPSQIFGLPSKSFVLMIIALWILGVGAAFSIIPIIPEMLDTVRNKYIDQKSEVSDYCSAIFNMSAAVGMITGPTLAGLLKDEIGFRLTFDIIGSSVLLFNILYIIIWGGIGSMIRSIKAKAVLWRKRKLSPTLSTDSPKHHLLNEENDFLNWSDIESESKDKLSAYNWNQNNFANFKEKINEESSDNSTDMSISKDIKGYSIN